MLFNICNGPYGMKVCALLLLEDGDGPGDPTPCNGGLTSPTPTVNTEFTLNTGLTPPQVIYMIGDPDLIISWSGVSNGNCDFTSSIEVSSGGEIASEYPHITSQAAVTSRLDGYEALYQVDSDAFTTVSTIDTGEDGNSYVITWTV